MTRKNLRTALENRSMTNIPAAKKKLYPNFLRVRKNYLWQNKILKINSAKSKVPLSRAFALTVAKE